MVQSILFGNIITKFAQNRLLKNSKTYLLFFFLWFAPLLGSAQTHNFLTYSLEEGLPQSQIYAMIEDAQGYLWLGTQGGGLSRFDGKTFINYGIRDGLSSNYIQALFEDKNGRIWIGTSNGICVFENGAIRDFSKQKLIVRTIYESDNQLFAANNSKTYVLKDSTFEQVRNEKTIPLDEVGVGEIRTFQTLENDDILIGTYGNGLHLFSNDSVSNFGLKNGISAKRILDIQKISEEEIWIATQDAGAIRWNPETNEILQLNDKNGLPTNHIRKVIKDRWGNIWMATSAGGLVKYLGKQFVHFDSENGLKGDYVYSVCESTNGAIWFSEYNKGIGRLDSSGITHFGKDSGFLDVKCKAIFEDSKNRLWIGTEGKGVGLLEADSFLIYTNENGLPSNWIRDIVETNDSSIWVATSDGIANLFKRNSILSLRPFDDKKYLKSGNTLSLVYHESKNQLWFGTQTGRVGFIKLPEGKIQFLDKNLNAAISSLRIDSTDYLWIASQGNGIFNINLNIEEPEITALEFDQTPLPKNTYLVSLDNENNLWAGTQSGVDKIILNESRQVVSIKHFGRQEGFVGIETCRNASICDQLGRLWFGTIGGLTCYTPGSIEPEPKKPNLQFKEVNLSYKPLIDSEFKAFSTSKGNLKEGLELPYNKNNLGFKFEAVHLGQPEKIRYQWKLTDSEWSPPSTQNEVLYSNLQPGDYQFQVRACVEEQCAELSTPLWEIRPPFWKTWWFYLISALSIIGLVSYVFFSRIRTIRKKAAAKQQQLEIENQLLHLEQQALQLQMNPHFIFNALNSIQSLIVSGDAANARLQLGKFAGLMRNILNNSRAEKITLEEEIQTLQKYLEIEQLNRNSHFNFEIKTSKNIFADDLELPPMLIQPFVENSVIHGVAHLPKGEGKIQISFDLKNDELHCKITDNGIGRQAAAQKTTKPNHRSIAMEVTRQRLAFLAKDRAIETLEVRDLESGTEVGLVVIV